MSKNGSEVHPPSRKGGAPKLDYKEIRFRGSRLDARRLEALAKHHELTPSAVLRRLIADAIKAARLEVPS
jgi:hypothetical protein